MIAARALTVPGIVIVVFGALLNCHGSAPPPQMQDGQVGLKDATIPGYDLWPASIDTLTEATPEVGALFGRAIAVGDFDGDGHPNLVVTSGAGSAGGAAGAGRVTIYTTADVPHAVMLTLTEPIPKVSANFGRFLAVGDINGDHVDDLLVGSFRADVGTNVRAGKVYAYLGGPTMDEVPDAVLTQPQPEPMAQFGAAIATGDINSDGYDDVVVGTHLADPLGVHDGGQAYVFMGGPGPGFDETADFTLTEPTPETFPEWGAEFGRGVAIGDVNNDGFADVIAAASWCSVGDVVGAGRVRVFLGSAAFDTVPDFLLQEPQPLQVSIFGWSIAVGDVNGDAAVDLVIGSPRADTIAGTPYRGTSVNTEGRAQVFFGGTSFDETADLVLAEPVPQLESHLGRDAILIGDLDGDGFNDIVIGAPGGHAGGADAQATLGAGRGQIFLGGPSLDTMADYWIHAPTPVPGSSFGASAALVDLDQDGIKDQLIVGAPGAGTGGEVYTFVPTNRSATHRRR